MELESENFLCVATPAAGKTLASLRVAHRLLEDETISQIVIVCPTDHLRTQWINEASNVGIHLNSLETNWEDQIVVTKDFVGLVTTYAQVSSRVEHLRAYLNKGNTLVVFDEIHHCGDEENLRWGIAVNEAFGNSKLNSHRRLLLSGTPFRTDNNPIPYVKYKPVAENSDYWQVEADYIYGYGDALRDDKVVRRIIFPSWEGKLTWSSDGEEHISTFQDELDFIQSKYRLRTAIHYQGQWIRDVLAAADKKLDEVRGLGYENAGALLLAKDQVSALELAKALEEITGEKPSIAISKMPEEMGEASKEISNYAKSDKRWIVAVKMVSEGVDIKRLHVMVYATNVLTRTFFRQAIGRVIRWDNNWNDVEADQTAWCYAPQDPYLVKHMKEIEKEITDFIRLSIEYQDLADRGALGREQYQTNLFQFIDADDAIEAVQVFSSEEFSRNEMLFAEGVFKGLPGFERLPSAVKAYAIRSGLLYKRLSNVDQETDTLIPVVPKPQQVTDFVIQTQKKTKKQTQKEIRSRLKSAVGRLVHTCQNNGIIIPGNNPYQTINTAWIRYRGKTQVESTIEDLDEKLNWVNQLTKRAIGGDWGFVNDL